MKIRRTTERAILNGALEERISTMVHETNALQKLKASQLANTRLMVNLLKFGHRLVQLKDKLGSVKGTSVKLPMVITKQLMASFGNTLERKEEIIDEDYKWLEH